jgi:hypothetical protein
VEAARQLDQERGARSAVVGAHERELAKPFGVVVAADQDHILAAAGHGGDHIGHREPAVRRRGVERLHASPDAGSAQLVDDVRPSPRRAGRPRGARTDGDEPLDVPQRGGSVEHRRQTRLLGAERQKPGEQDRRERQTDAPAGHRGFTPTAP